MKCETCGKRATRQLQSLACAQIWIMEYDENDTDIDSDEFETDECLGPIYGSNENGSQWIEYYCEKCCPDMIHA